MALKLAEKNIILNNIKLLQNINDNTQDNLIKLYIQKAENMITGYCNNEEFNPTLLDICEEIALKMFLNHGLSPFDLSVVSHSFSGDSYTYDKDENKYLSESIKLRLNNFRKLKLPKIGGV